MTEITCKICGRQREQALVCSSCDTKKSTIIQGLEKTIKCISETAQNESRVIANFTRRNIELESEVARLNQTYDTLKADYDTEMADRPWEDLKRVIAENDRLKGELAEAKEIILKTLHKTENARIWGGKEWTYQGGLHMKRIHDMVEAAVRAAKGKEQT